KFLVQGQAQERRPVRAALLLASKGYVRPRRRHPAAAPSWKRPGAGGCPSSDGANFDHLGDVVAQHVLDAHLEGGSRGGAAGTGALHAQIDHTLLEAMEGDVPAIL